MSPAPAAAAAAITGGVSVVAVMNVTVFPEDAPPVETTCVGFGSTPRFRRGGDSLVGDIDVPESLVVLLLALAPLSIGLGVKVSFKTKEREKDLLNNKNFPSLRMLLI